MMCMVLFFFASSCNQVCTARDKVLHLTLCHPGVFESMKVVDTAAVIDTLCKDVYGCSQYSAENVLPCSFDSFSQGFWVGGCQQGHPLDKFQTVYGQSQGHLRQNWCRQHRFSVYRTPKALDQPENMMFIPVPFFSIPAAGRILTAIYYTNLKHFTVSTCISSSIGQFCVRDDFFSGFPERQRRRKAVISVIYIWTACVSFRYGIYYFTQQSTDLLPLCNTFKLVVCLKEQLLTLILPDS